MIGRKKFRVDLSLGFQRQSCSEDDGFVDAK